MIGKCHFSAFGNGTFFFAYTQAKPYKKHRLKQRETGSWDSIGKRITISHEQRFAPDASAKIELNSC